ncbi:MAG: hypothetical protein ACI9SC_002803 [Gammaproteobacteria bacterium]|jgi:hypothetical protein
MKDDTNLQPLLNHLCNISRLEQNEARKLVAEVIAYFSETTEVYVQRRHKELKQDEGLSNTQIYQRIEIELGELVFASPTLSQRQIRRIIYG